MFSTSRTRFARLLLILAAVCLSGPRPAGAQSETPYDLVNAVNGLRALHGLQPYTVDAGLMAYAQQHSEYQASTKTSTHIHSDGTRPLDLGLEENVASGTVGVFTIDLVVYEGWSDWGHRHILTGYADGEIGAGVAFSDDGFVWYTVDIRPGEELADTPAPFVGLQTSTPNPDGSLVHVVGFGQTLWSIATSYGVTVDEIRRLNGLAADSTVIQTGQKLIIRPAGAASAVAAALTPSMAGETATAMKVPFTPTLSATAAIEPSPAPTATPADVEPDASQKRAGWGLAIALGIAILSLAVAAAVGFWQARADKLAEPRGAEGHNREDPRRDRH